MWGREKGERPTLGVGEREGRETNTGCWIERRARDQRWVLERERETHRERDRETLRERETQREREGERQRERDTETEREGARTNAGLVFSAGVVILFRPS